LTSLRNYLILTAVYSVDALHQHKSRGKNKAKFNRVHAIVNPDSSKNQPVLHTSNNVFHPVDINCDIYATKAGATRSERGRLTLEKAPVRSLPALMQVQFSCYT
jgi:hypothetical protein